MIQKVFDYIEENNMLLPNDVVVVGVSGGADSVCLLYLLDEVRQSIPFSLYVVHVNHGVRKEAKEEAEYVKRICREKDIPFFLMESNIKIVAKEEGISEEEAGRELRYRSFRSVLKEVGKEREGKIAVAHNKNDNAETMLLNLFRGSGLTGLQGILPVRDNIIRPLLCIERHEIEEYLRKRNIPFCNDKTNFETVYTRNKIRNKLLPIVLSIFPSSISKMSESSRLVTQANSFIEEFAKEKMKNAILHQESGVIRSEERRVGKEC